MMGAERRSMVMSEKEKKLTAYHEAGHAIVGLNVPEHDPVYKVTIIPRGRALGVTMFLPEERPLQLPASAGSRARSRRCSAAASPRSSSSARVVTTGASNDIERATEIARNMVTKWGLSDRLGPLTYAEDEGEVFLGRSVTQHKQVSRRDRARRSTRKCAASSTRTTSARRRSSRRNLDKLHMMAEALLKYETIDATQINDIMAGREPQPPADWDDRDAPTTGSRAARMARGRRADRAAGAASTDIERDAAARPGVASRMPAILHACSSHCRGFALDLDAPVVMGVLNVTPDSFSDGGRFAERARRPSRTLGAWSRRARRSSTSAANRRGRARRRSTRTRSCARVIPVIEALARARHDPDLGRHAASPR